MTIGRVGVWVCSMTKLKKPRHSDSEQCEIQRKSRKGRLTSLQNRWCAHNSELQLKLKPPGALGYLITANFRAPRVFPMEVLATSCLS